MKKIPKILYSSMTKIPVGDLSLEVIWVCEIFFLYFVCLVNCRCFVFWNICWFICRDMFMQSTSTVSWSLKLLIFLELPQRHFKVIGMKNFCPSDQILFSQIKWNTLIHIHANPFMKRRQYKLKWKTYFVWLPQTHAKNVTVDTSTFSVDLVDMAMDYFNLFSKILHYLFY